MMRTMKAKRVSLLQAEKSGLEKEKEKKEDKEEKKITTNPEMNHLSTHLMAQCYPGLGRLSKPLP